MAEPAAARKRSAADAPSPPQPPHRPRGESAALRTLSPMLAAAAAPQQRQGAGGIDEEWLLPTGHGGFAMGTVSGAPARQYHALLNAASAPPVGRVASVMALQEAVAVAGAEARLLSPGEIFQQPAPGSASGGSTLRSFSRDATSVTWVHEAAPGVTVRKTLRVGWRANMACVAYRVDACAGGPASMALRPLLALRDFHHRLEDAAGFAERFRATAEEGGRLRVEAEGQAVVMVCSAGAFEDDPRTTPHVDYATSRAREDKEVFGECLWSPGVFRMPLSAASPTEFSIAFALAPDEPDASLATGTPREAHLQRCVQGALPAHAQLLRPLIEAADDFLVTRKVAGRELMTIVAGYPWFADWGRDTMISLPGLFLTTGRIAEARSCLETFAAFVSEGMIPNRFDDDEDGKAHYNTVDASLWYLEALRCYAEASGEKLQADGVLLRAATDIIAGYTRGTRYGICVDPADGLVTAGDAQTQLTWMDALRDGVAFTPRFGKCVEINALWCNGLHAVADLEAAAGQPSSGELRGRAARASAAFAAAFVRPDGMGLWDRLEPAPGGAWAPSGEIRPNQLFAASLKHSPLDAETRRAVVNVCREHLLTPVGLRTLSPKDAGYRARFKGGMLERDAAYHNGTVWPWLLGPYSEAVLRAGSFSSEARAEAAGAFAGVLSHLAAGGCLGQIAEVYDGDAPRDQEGCPAQAWSVAEALRVTALLLEGA